MAKKKTKKSKSNNKFEYTNEIVGVIIILIGVIGILGTGIIGNMVKNFSIFLVGTLYLLLLITLVIVGILLIFKENSINLLSSRMIGVYILLISFLVLLHIKYIELNGSKGTAIITETFDNLMVAFSNSSALSNSAITLTKLVADGFNDVTIASNNQAIATGKTCAGTTTNPSNTPDPSNDSKFISLNAILFSFFLFIF